MRIPRRQKRLRKPIHTAILPKLALEEYAHRALLLHLPLEAAPALGRLQVVDAPAPVVVLYELGLGDCGADGTEGYKRMSKVQVVGSGEDVLVRTSPPNRSRSGLTSLKTLAGSSLFRRLGSTVSVEYGLPSSYGVCASEQ